MPTDPPSPLDDRPAGELLGIYRVLRGWSQKELARRLGVAPAQVSRWECRRSTPRPALRARIEEELGLPRDRW